MESIQPTPFIIAWHNAMILGAIIMVAAGILLFLFYNLRVGMISDYHQKYNFINAKEIKTYKLVGFCFAIAAMLVINLYQMDEMKDVEVWFFVRLFMAFAGGTLIGYISYLILEYYYPTRLDKKLKKWRYMTRRNPKTGNKMRLLSEEEEDAHLEAHQIEEEATIHSVDYDVWLDEKTGFKKVEKYNAYQHAEECPECGYFTLKIYSEEIETKPTENETGLLLKHYRCEYCNHREARETVLAKLSTNV